MVSAADAEVWPLLQTADSWLGAAQSRRVPALCSAHPGFLWVSFFLTLIASCCSCAPCPAGAGSLPCPQLAVCEMGLRRSRSPPCLSRVPGWGCKERPASLCEGLPRLSGAVPVRGNVLPAGLRNCGVLSVKVPGSTRHQLSTAGGED